ncbi:MAG: tetratricopeptide repeat protein [Hyphomicrobiaceae bacterium]
MLRILFALVAAVSFSTSALASDQEACRSKRGTSAMAACDRVINSRETSHKNVGTALIDRGQQHYENKDYDKAIADFTRAMTYDPPYVQLAYGNRGNCYYMLKEDNVAIENYTRAIEIDSDYVSAYAARGVLYEKAGMIKKARADFEQALDSKSIFSDTKWGHETAREHLKKLNGE